MLEEKHCQCQNLLSYPPGPTPPKLDESQTQILLDTTCFPRYSRLPSTHQRSLVFRHSPAHVLAYSRYRKQGNSSTQNLHLPAGGANVSLTQGRPSADPDVTDAQNVRFSV